MTRKLALGAFYFVISIAAARAETIQDEALLAKLKVLMAEKSVKSKLNAIVCEYDKKACSHTAQAKAESPPKKGGSAPIIPLADYSVHTTLLLRDAYSTVAFISGDNNDPSQKGASFTLTNSLQDKKTTFVGNGALMVATYGNVNPNDLAIPIGHFALVPGVEWANKVINGKQTGTVSPKAGAEVEIQSGLFDHYLRSSAVYTTDVNTQASIYGVETGWQPASTAYWLNVKKRIYTDSSIWFGFYPSLNANYYHAGSIGDFVDLTPGRDYLWLGPEATATISFDEGTALSPLSFYTKLFYLYNVIQPRNVTVNYLESGLLYKITNLAPSVLANSGAISIDVHYSTGRKPETLERVADWYVGLNVKLGDVSK